MPTINLKCKNGSFENRIPLYSKHSDRKKKKTAYSKHFKKCLTTQCMLNYKAQRQQSDTFNQNKKMNIYRSKVMECITNCLPKLFSGSLLCCGPYFLKDQGILVLRHPHHTEVSSSSNAFCHAAWQPFFLQTHKMGRILVQSTSNALYSNDKNP